MRTIEDIRKPIQNAYHDYEKALEEAMQSDNPLLQEVLRYVYSKQGKQMRPLLVLLAAQLCHGVTDKSIKTAVALETLHNASLIHDDVVDNSPIRHGAEAVHKHWSNKVAVLVGDFMLAKVIACITDIRNTPILNIVARLGKSLSSGELVQLHHNRSMWISEEEYFHIIDQKTAQLFASCTEAGAESSGGSQRQVSALREFGHQLGICFQLKDDVLDYSDAEELGKPTMNDLQDGKATLPILVSLQRAPKEEADYIRQLAESLHNSDNRIDAEQEIKSFVLRYEGVRYTYAQMQTHKKSAIEALSIFHDNPTKQSLLDLLEYTINRIH